MRDIRSGRRRAGPRIAAAVADAAVDHVRAAVAVVQRDAAFELVVAVVHPVGAAVSAGVGVGFDDEAAGWRGGGGLVRVFVSEGRRGRREEGRGGRGEWTVGSGWGLERTYAA